MFLSEWGCFIVELEIILKCSGAGDPPSSRVHVCYHYALDPLTFVDYIISTSVVHDCNLALLLLIDIDGSIRSFHRDGGVDALLRCPAGVVCEAWVDD